MIKRSIYLFFIWLISHNAYAFPIDLPNRPEQYLEHVTLPIYYATAVVWGVVVTDKPEICNDVCTVEIEYILLSFIDSQGSTLISKIDYINKYDTRLGGLYLRFPTWFYNDNITLAHWPTDNIDVINKILTINPGKHPDLVTHFWTPRSLMNPNRVPGIEIKYRITGPVSVRFGLDWWRAYGNWNGWDSTCIKSNNCEMFQSDVIGDTGGEWVIKVFPESNRDDSYFGIDGVLRQRAIQDHEWKPKGLFPSKRAIRIIFEDGTYKTWVKGQESIAPK